MASESMSSVGSNSSSESCINSGIVHDQTDALLDCNICYNAPPTSPVITSCGHMYCWPCLQQWLQNQETCPVCRSMVGSGINVVHIHGVGRGNGRDHGANPNVRSPNSERPSQLPTRTEVLAAIDVLLRVNQRLQDERKAASEVMRDQLNALNWELGLEMRSQSVDHSSVPQQEQDSTLHLMQELIDRTVDALQESGRLRQLLDEASWMGDRLVRVRRFVRANRDYADLWTQFILKAMIEL